MVWRGDEAEEQRLAGLHCGEFADALELLGGHAAEEEIGDVPLEDEIVAVDREDALEHADGAVDEGEDGQHRRHAEADARDADEGAQLVATEVDENEREKAHEERAKFWGGNNPARDCARPGVARKLTPENRR